MRALIMRLFGRTVPGGLDCRQVGRMLQHYLDDEIDPESARGIEAHLDACRRCGLEAETYERITSTLAASAPALPADSIDRLRAFGEELARGDATR